MGRIHQLVVLLSFTVISLFAAPLHPVFFDDKYRFQLTGLSTTASGRSYTAKRDTLTLRPLFTYPEKVTITASIWSFRGGRWVQEGIPQELVWENDSQMSIQRVALPNWKQLASLETGEVLLQLHNSATRTSQMVHFYVSNKGSKKEAEIQILKKEEKMISNNNFNVEETRRFLAKQEALLEKAYLEELFPELKDLEEEKEPPRKRLKRDKWEEPFYHSDDECLGLKEELEDWEDLKGIKEELWNEKEEFSMEVKKESSGVVKKESKEEVEEVDMLSMPENFDQIQDLPVELQLQMQLSSIDTQDPLYRVFWSFFGGTHAAAWCALPLLALLLNSKSNKRKNTDELFLNLLDVQDILWPKKQS